MNKPMSDRAKAAHLVAAAVRVLELDRVFGGDVSLSPWGKGKRYTVLFSLPRTLDGVCYVNKPNQIVLEGRGPHHLDALCSSAELAVAVLYARFVAFDLELVDNLLDGSVAALDAIPAGVMDGILQALPVEVDSPEGWSERILAQLEREYAGDVE